MCAAATPEPEGGERLAVSLPVLTAPEIAVPAVALGRRVASVVLLGGGHQTSHEPPQAVLVSLSSTFQALWGLSSLAPGGDWDGDGPKYYLDLGRMPQELILSKFYPVSH